MRRILLAGLAAMLAAPVAAQDVTPAGFKLAPLKEVTPNTPAKQLFGRKPVAANLGAELQYRSIGFYSKGCLANATALPITGKTWQVMRLSRNRNWGNPTLIRFLEALSARVAKQTSWNGLLVGDISQPRGGPMLTGHASHQVGLDADIWLTPMPTRVLDRETRETMSARRMVRADRRDVSDLWTPEHHKVIRLAAIDPRVERIFINPALKRAICREATGDRSWLSKVRPTWGHDYHFHIRMACLPGDVMCKPQPAPKAGDDGCGKELDWWLSDAVLNPPKPKPDPNRKPPKPRPPIVMADLPAACQQVLVAP